MLQGVGVVRRGSAWVGLVGRAVPIPVGVNALAFGGLLVWLVAEINDPANRGTWGAVAAIMAGMFLIAPAIAASCGVALIATGVLALTRLRSPVVIGVLATLAGVTVVAAVTGVLVLLHRGS
jgi:hypothetical protein